MRVAACVAKTPKEVWHGDGTVTTDGKRMSVEALFRYRAGVSTRDRGRVRGGQKVKES